MSKQENWGEVIHFLDGKCWGIAPNLKSVCLGNETEVREMLSNPEKRTGNEVIDGIISLEIQLRKEVENGQNTGRSAVGGGPPRAFQYRKANIR